MTAALLPAAAPFTPTRWDRWRIAVCAGLVALNILQYVLILAGVPRFYERLVTGTVPTVLIGGQVNVDQAMLLAEAAARGMTPAGYAVYFLGLNLGITVVFWGAAGLVLAKAGGHWFRWLVAMILLFYPSGQLWRITLISQVNYHWVSLFGILWPLYLLFFYLYPDGRGVPRWSRWPMGALVLTHLAIQTLGVVAEQLGAAIVLPAGVLPFFNLVILLALALALLCQVYRYVRIAGPVERKQVQWFVGGLALFVGSGLLTSLLAGKDELTAADGFAFDLDSVSGLIIPIAITISILRYRLWDIDVIIRRTLVYAVLSGLLALVYFGSVVVLESVLRGLIGSGSQVAIVLSTLLIAALFGPLRGRVQAIIDQRFYRRKYDAARTLAAFGASMRDNVDLDALGDRLTAVVDDTMQPAHTSLWLRP